MKLQQCVFPVQIADNMGAQNKTRVNRAMPPLIIWSIWLKNDKAQSFLINITKTLNIYKHNVEIHSDYPTSKPVPK